MGNQPIFSIVTPSYNQGAFIRTTIESVLTQDYPRIEYRIMDGGSTDNTLQIIKEYEHDPRLHWVSERDKGQSDAINKGLQHISGDIVAYLNSDDIYLPGTLRRVVDYFEAHPTIGMVYGDCHLIDSIGTIIGQFGKNMGTVSEKSTSSRRMISQGDSFPQPATFWRREVMDRIGLFDTTLQNVMDYDFFVRVALSFSIGYIAEPLAGYRLHPASKTISQEEQQWQELMCVSEIYGLRKWMPWYIIRVSRHRGLRMLPAPIQKIIRKLRRRVELG